MDLIQTTALVVISSAVWWAFFLLRHEIHHGMQTLLDLMRSQRETEHKIQRLWERIDEIERREKERGQKG